MKKNRPYHVDSRRCQPFDPGHGFVNQAIEDFLARGGKISVLLPGEHDYQIFLLTGNDFGEVDEFLLGK